MKDERTRGRGCCLSGCLTVAIGLVVLIVAAVVVTRYFIHRTILRYSDTFPMALPKVEASPTRIRSLQTQLEEFSKAVQSGQQTEDLVLDGPALNLLISITPSLQRLSDNVYVTIEENELKVQFSWPLEKLPLFPAPGRYVNGTARVRVLIQNGTPLLTVRSIEVKNEKIPDHILAALRIEDFVRKLCSEPRVAEALRKVRKIEIRDDTVVVVPYNPNR